MPTEAPKPASPDRLRRPPLLVAIAAPALAAGLGWGIRGQYGHGAGAMIAGVLASLTLVLAYVPHWPAGRAMAAAALMTAGISLGGSMTYGQTLGLMHDPELVGRWDAFAWGALGLAVKGGVWIGLAAALLGVGLGEKRCRFAELCFVFFALAAVYAFGVWLLNSPFDPARKLLPRFYFSDNWAFEPHAALEPRRENWGGLLAVWIALTTYLGAVRRDGLAVRISLWGFLAGSVGFPAGQCVQAGYQWNAAAIAAGPWAEWARNVNWWNMMETTFGAVWGALLSAGLWRNRAALAQAPRLPERLIAPAWEALLIVACLLITLANAADVDWPRAVRRPAARCEAALFVASAAAIVATRWWPYFFLLPLVAAPIAAKTVSHLAAADEPILNAPGRVALAAALLGGLTLAAGRLAARDRRRQPAQRTAAIALLATAATYFALNTAVFDFAWPWRAWTRRTPNQVIFMACTAALCLLALWALKAANEQSAPLDAETEPPPG